MQVRRLAPVAAAVLLAAVAAVLAPLGDSLGARALLGLVMLVVALPGLAAFDGVLRLSDRVAEQAQLRAAEAEQIRREVRELGVRHDAAVASTSEEIDRLARDLTATRAYARGARDDLVSVQERLGTLERALAATRTSLGELAGTLDAVGRDAAAARQESVSAREQAAAAREQAAAAREQAEPPRGPSCSSRAARRPGCVRPCRLLGRMRPRVARRVSRCWPS